MPATAVSMVSPGRQGPRRLGNSVSRSTVTFVNVHKVITFARLWFVQRSSAFRCTLHPSAARPTVINVRQRSRKTAQVVGRFQLLHTGRVVSSEICLNIFHFIIFNFNHIEVKNRHVFDKQLSRSLCFNFMH